MLNRYLIIYICVKGEVTKFYEIVKILFLLEKNKYLSNFVVDCILVLVVNDKLDIKIREKRAKR